MATVSVNIPDGVLPRVLDAFTAAYSYDADKDGTKAAFAQKQVANFIMETVRSNEATKAANKALKDAATKANTEIVIT